MNPDAERQKLSTGRNRCRKSDAALYPDGTEHYPEQVIIPCEAFRECDFGDFEGKKYLELSGDPDYQKWLDSKGIIAFPGGEHPDAFRKRCENAFLKIAEAYHNAGSIAFVVHGGTIMAILSRFAGGNFFDYQLPNGFLITGEFEQGRIIL